MTPDDYDYSAGHDPEWNGDADREEDEEDAYRERIAHEIDAQEEADGWALRDALNAFWDAMPAEEPEVDDGTENPFENWLRPVPLRDKDRPISLVCADGVSRFFALAPCDLAGGRRIAQRVQREVGR